RRESFSQGINPLHLLGGHCPLSALKAPMIRYQIANCLPDRVAILVGESVGVESIQLLERSIVLNRRKLGDNLKQLTPPRAVFTHEFEEFGGSETYAKCIVTIGNPRVHVWRPVPPLRPRGRHSHSVQ